MRLLKGKVVSGVGNFSYWIVKLQEYYFKKTGMKLFPGTLNIELEHPYSIPEKVIRLEKEEYGGTVSVNIVACSIFGRKAFILRTDKNEQEQGHHVKTIIEVATDVKLRDRYNLNDGDVVEVEVAD
jgi:riboflavin kinase, archaea type